MTSSLTRNLKLFALLFLLPLAMSLVGVWQLQRANAHLANSPGAVTARVVELKTLKQQLAADRSIQIQIEGKTYSHPMAGVMVQREIDKLQNQQARNANKGWQYLALAAKLAMVAGACALVLGVSVLILAVVAGRLARRTRADLMSIFAMSSKAMPWLLAAQIVLMVLALTGLTGAEAWQGYDTMVNGNASRGEGKLYVLGLLMGVIAVGMGLLSVFKLRKAFATFEGQPLLQFGRLVSQADAPRLWRHVSQLAEKLKAQPPQNIVVGLTGGFYVTAHDMTLLPEKKSITGETLYLPLSYAALIRPAEFDAILGHELGHFSGADTAYSLRFIPMHTGMHRSLNLLSEEGDWMAAPARMLGEFLMEQVNHAEMHWSREREFAADEAGKQVAGSRASACALVRSSAVAPVISNFLDDLFNHPEDAPTDLLQALVEHARKHGLADPDLSSESATAHPTDTHPPTVQRIKALGETLDPALLAEACHPVDDKGLAFMELLFANRLALQHQLSADLSRVAVEQKEEVKAELQNMVQEAEPAFELFEKTKNLQWLAGGFFVIGIIAALVLLYRGITLPTRGALVGMLPLVGGALALSAFAAWRFKRAITKGQTPILELTPTGIKSHSLGQDIAWTAVDDVHMTVISHSYNGVPTGKTCKIEIQLNAETPAPELKNKNFRRLSYQRKQHKLVINFTQPQHMSHDDLSEKINRQRRADHAQRALAKMTRGSAST
jgi:Zn-dependent protease with chaperone function